MESKLADDDALYASSRDSFEEVTSSFIWVVKGCDCYTLLAFALYFYGLILDFFQTIKRHINLTTD